MKLKQLLAGIFCVLLFGCAADGLAAVKPEIDVEIINRSSRDMEKAKAHFGEYDCGWGWVIKNSTAVYAFYPHPITADVELNWDEDGKHRVEKLDLSKIYPPGKSGRLTFTVYEGRVEVSFREKTP